MNRTIVVHGMKIHLDSRFAHIGGEQYSYRDCQMILDNLKRIERKNDEKLLTGYPLTVGQWIDVVKAAKIHLATV